MHMRGMLRRRKTTGRIKEEKEHTVMCPPQPSFTHRNALSTVRPYQSARSVPVGVNLKTALQPVRPPVRISYDQCERDLDAAENLRLDGELRLRPVRGLDNNTERRPAPTAECKEQVLVLARVRGAEDAVGGDDLHLDLVVRMHSV